MSKRLALELLQKVNNPSHNFTELEPDDDGVSVRIIYLTGTLYIAELLIIV